MKFELWLQKQLNLAGAKPRLAEDGDFGRASIAALRAFQSSRGLNASGVADNNTVAELRKIPTVADAPIPVPVERMPPWMSEMDRKAGLHEVRDNAALIEFLKIGKYLGNPKNLPWCGDAVESVMAKTLPQEALPSNPFFAQNWKTFGVDAGGPVVGSIGVIRWSASSGHVGIVARVEGSKIFLLGGNQSNAINITSFPRSKFIAFRWPKTFPRKTYPPLMRAGLTGTESGTR